MSNLKLCIFQPNNSAENNINMLIPLVMITSCNHIGYTYFIWYCDLLKSFNYSIARTQSIFLSFTFALWFLCAYVTLIMYNETHYYLTHSYISNSMYSQLESSKMSFIKVNGNIHSYLYRETGSIQHIVFLFHLFNHIGVCHIYGKYVFIFCVCEIHSIWIIVLINWNKPCHQFMTGGLSGPCLIDWGKCVSTNIIKCCVHETFGGVTTPIRSTNMCSRCA